MGRGFHCCWPARRCSARPPFRSSDLTASGTSAISRWARAIAVRSRSCIYRPFHGNAEDDEDGESGGGLFTIGHCKNPGRTHDRRACKLSHRCCSMNETRISGSDVGRMAAQHMGQRRQCSPSCCWQARRAAPGGLGWRRACPLGPGIGVRAAH